MPKIAWPAASRGSPACDLTFDCVASGTTVCPAPEPRSLIALTPREPFEDEFHHLRIPEAIRTLWITLLSPVGVDFQVNSQPGFAQQGFSEVGLQPLEWAGAMPTPF